MRTAIRALLAVAVLAILTGLVYPLVLTGIAQVAMPGRADGSLVERDGRTVGSALIGQTWSGEEWFHGRPSAIEYDASISSGSNLGPTSADLATAMQQRLDAILALEGPYVDGLVAAEVPADLVTASASGLDPDISIEAAALQAPRIAAVRGLTLDEVQRLIDDNTSGRALGFLGQPRVNVLLLNLALDEAAPMG
jgi:K+-transporting ATPase ATPase C chain